ncbi:plakophilin-2 [Myripristis murdjan]|uniref:Plakophilin 2 n=1 Tax=Myripristis murdjan TaxID=586833 RepID=A0A667XIJ7_9TELE|nr:plakophilin-2 [Myripristis murdjan]
MDEVFFKSVLPAQESLVLEDTSLAMPAEENIISPTKVNSYEKSLRVHQQVQLTLARRGKRAASNGSIHLQKNTPWHSDVRDGPSPNMKVNGMGYSDHSLSNGHVRRPSRRVEVSPATSPLSPRSHMAHWTVRFGTCPPPGPSQPPATGPPLNHSLGSDSFRRYAFSEVPRGTQMHASTSAHRSYGRTSIKQTAGPQPLLADATLQHSKRNHFSQSHLKTDIPKERSSVRRQGGYGTLGASQRGDGVAWLAQVRSQGLRRLNSYPPSVVSMEVDMAKRLEPDLPIQQIQSKNLTASKLESKAPELTLERAVNLLTQDNEDTLICAASLIQNQCFNSADAKKMVFYLHGIVKLLPLLQNDNEEVQRAAAGALRNIVFQNNENKMEVKENGGVGTILDVLKSSRDVETRRQLTGLLWNLSSHDLLKEHLSREALPVLTKTVLVPSSGLSEGENPKDELLADSEVFHNATGCLRNVSSAGPDGRKAMRECENLIDSLVYYIRGTIADYKPDDKSTENCVCILHNLSYQIEAELPQKYAKEIHESRQNSAPKAKSPGCFGYRSAKITEDLQRQCPLLEEKANPHGIEWLWSAITVRMYLSLMARSLRHFTQEAAIGALQNITAGNGMVTEAIAHTIVQRENGLQQVRKMLQEGESDVKRTAVSLVKNLSRYRELHADIVKQVLPELVGMLPNNDTGSDVPTEVTASLCHILINLSQNETQHVKAILNHGALPKIINISTKDTGYGPTRAGQAACILLHSMWNHSELHGAYKKGGYRKSDFINARTTKAVNSLRD